MAEFIGQKALEEVARTIQPEIIMGAAHYRPGVFDKMQIKISTGLDFKDIRYVLNRKGHTTKRKRVDSELNSTIGNLEERKMIGYKSWNHYTDNEDNYHELPKVDANNKVFYPQSEIAMRAILANYGDDVFDCLFHGDDTIADDANNAYLNLFTGFVTYLRNDITSGRISVLLGNLQNCDAIAAASSNSDTAAWDSFEEWYDLWSPALQNQNLVLVYMTSITGKRIALGYKHSNSNNMGVTYLNGSDGKPNGTWTVPEYSNVIFVPESSFGTGDMMIATTPENFEYGVDDSASASFVRVKAGTDRDMTDIQFQVESIQGCRIINVNASNFCMSNGTLTAKANAGDYTKSTYAVVSSDTAKGTVTVNNAAAENDKDYAPGTVLTLKATPVIGNVFVKWVFSNGKTSTDAEVAITTTYNAQSATAMFAAQ